MSLKWSEHHGTYLYQRYYKDCHECSSVNWTDWIKRELLKPDTQTCSPNSSLIKDNVMRFEIDINQLSILFKMQLEAAKTTGVICLIGIGIGFGITSWIIYKIYLKSKQKQRKDAKLDKKDIGVENFEKENMGNTNGLSAGIQVCIDDISNMQSGVRHRQNLERKSSNQTAVSASIIEKESGAYISRQAFEKSSQNGNSIQTTESQNSISGSSGSNCYIKRPPMDLQVVVDCPTMNDSGYLDLEVVQHISSQVSVDSLLAPTPSTLIEFEKETSEPPKVSSVRSSLSDQAMHDLASDFSSFKGSSDHDNDEDIISVEICECNDGDLASTETLLGSLTRSSDDTCENSLASNETTVHSSGLLDSRQGLQSQDSDTRDSWTDSSDLWRDNSELSSCYSPSPRHLPTKGLSNENLHLSSTLSSPVFIPKNYSHSRTSSITSADIDLEASAVDVQTRDEIDKMEIELIEIRQEICEVEEKLEDLMSRDTAQLYFNVDNMKKLTEVVLNSEDIQLTSSEIAKAFHILRKYRYNFPTPEKRQAFTHKEAEGPVKKDMSADKSLPYLDLADSSYVTPSKHKSISDWVDSVSPLTNGISEGAMIVTEWEIADFCISQPILQQGYQQLMDDYGFSSICLLKLEESAFQAAAVVSVIIHDKTANLLSTDVNTYCQRIKDLCDSSHPYISQWYFKYLPRNNKLPADTMQLCIRTLFSQLKTLKEVECPTRRRHELIQLFNFTSSIRSLIVEGIRLLTFLRVCDLYNEYVSNGDFPLYTWLLFARETSESPRSYFLNHIQSPKEVLPDQIDISLLADTLGVNLQTFRPTKPERDDFMSMSQGENDIDIANSVPLAVHSPCSYAILY